MLRIGTLTFHQSTNYGGILQAYALQRALTECGADSKIVNYRCEAIRKGNIPFLITDFSLKGILGTIFRAYPQIKKNKVFKQFRKQYMSVTEREYTRENIVEADIKFDVFVTGSDQIWRLDLTGYDHTYFLDFTQKKKYAYSASLGAEAPNVSDEAFFKEMLGTYNGISVREKETAVALQNLLKRRVTWTVDPVFLLSQQHWVKLAGKRIEDKPYIFVFRLHDKNVYEYAERLKKITGLKIISLESSLRGMSNAKRIRSIKVENFLNYINYAEHIVTDSFHCTAFALIFNRQVHPVLQRSNKNMNNRLLSLMSMIKHESCIISEQTENTAVINYDIVIPFLNNEINKAKEYLKNICEANDATN